MGDAPTTQPSLLVRLCDKADQEAWSQFVDVYAPLVYGYARRGGLQDADAADLTQDVLRAVSGAFGGLKYDRTRGSFRGWLFTVARNKLRDFKLGQARRPQATGSSSVQEFLAEHPAPHEEHAWDRDYEQRLFHWAADRVKADFQASTWRAFWQLTMEGQAARIVAAELRMSVGAVYIAKSRVLARLRAEIKHILDE